MVKNTAIILSAGRGKRMQSAMPKQYLELNGKPIIYYSLKAYETAPEIDNIIIVAASGDHDFVRSRIVERYGLKKVTDIVTGGRERYHSVANGLEAPGAADSDFVFIHDGSRPFIDTDVIRRAAHAVRDHPAIVVGMPARDTVKRVNEAGFVQETLPRDTIWLVQTPQVFAAPLIRSAYQTLFTNERDGYVCGITITDDAMVVETFTQTKVALIPGSPRNTKITVPEDLEGL